MRTNIEILESLSVNHKKLKEDKPYLLFKILKAMDIARTEQLTLTVVGCSLPTKEEISSKLRQLEKRWELSKNEDEKQAFNLGFKSCLSWLKERNE